MYYPLFQQMFIIYPEHIWLDCKLCGHKMLFRSKDRSTKLPYSINIVCDTCHKSGWIIRVISEIPEEDIPEE